MKTKHMIGIFVLCSLVVLLFIPMVMRSYYLFEKDRQELALSKIKRYVFEFKSWYERDSPLENPFDAAKTNRLLRNQILANFVCGLGDGPLSGTNEVITALKQLKLRGGFVIDPVYMPNDPSKVEVVVFSAEPVGVIACDSGGFDGTSTFMGKGGKQRLHTVLSMFSKRGIPCSLTNNLLDELDQFILPDGTKRRDGDFRIWDYDYSRIK